LPIKKWSILKRHRVAILFFILFLVTFSFSFYESVEFPNENSYSGNLGSISITVSPLNLYYEQSQIVGPLIELTALNNLNSTDNLFLFMESGTHKYSYEYYLSPHEFLKVYLSLNDSVLNANIIYINFSYSSFKKTVEINIKNTIIPFLAEVSLLLSIVSYMLFIFLFEETKKFIPYLILFAFFLISPFLGQRYDMYFMIASPLHIIQNVNPFLASKYIPGGLKWEYPPLYLYYGVAVEFIISHMNIIRFPTNIIYPGVIWNYNSMAWRGFVTGYLPLLYLIMKIPMIMSTFLIFIILKNETSKLNITKLWLLNPAVILIGVIWGQIDVIAALMMLFSIVQLRKGNTHIASISATVGAFVKIFPVFIIPLILIRSKNKLRDLILVATVSLASIIPYFMFGNFKQNIMELAYSRSVPTYNNIFSSNGITWQIILGDIGVKNFPSLGLIVFLPAFIIIVYLYWRRKMDTNITIIMIFSIFFMTYNYVNPQYFILVIPIFLMMKEIKLFIIYSAIPSIYVFLTYTLPYFVNPYISYNYFSSYLGQIEHVRQYVTSSYPILWTFIIISTGIYFLTFLWSIKRSSGFSRDNPPDSVILS